MKILSVITNLKEEKGGPPQVLKIKYELLTRKKKIIDVLQLERISLFYLLKIFFYFPQKKRFIIFLKNMMLFIFMKYGL